MSSQEAGFHYQILGIDPQASLGEIKKAYRRLAHRYHPDKSEPGLRHKNTEIMIRLNAAYLRACNEAAARQKTSGGENHTTTPAQNTKPPSAPPREAPTSQATPQPPPETAPAKPKDPAYSYYKQGHLYFHRGFYKFYRKKVVIENKLQAALEILNNFQKAYEYYTRVIDEYPQSPWCADSRFKIKKIRKLTPIYQKIFERLRELNEEELKKLKTWEEITRRNGFCSVKDLERNFLHIWEVKKL